ncbi:hypothetical protein HDU98_001904 [Podochytrium sp. JEL0797]|nr:hypothetical protein HDU98_001904 [Podochytrium sp. JEL0797]
MNPSQQDMSRPSRFVNVNLNKLQTPHLLQNIKSRTATPHFLQNTAIVAAITTSLYGLVLLLMNGIGSTRGFAANELGVNFKLTQKVFGGVQVLVGVIGAVACYKRMRLLIRAFGVMFLSTGLMQLALSVATMVLVSQPNTQTVFSSDCLNDLKGSTLMSVQQTQFCAQATKFLKIKVILAQVFVMIVSILFQVAVVRFAIDFSRDPQKYDAKSKMIVEPVELNQMDGGIPRYGQDVKVHGDERA